MAHQSSPHPSHPEVRSVVVSRDVRPGHEEQFAAWVRRLDEALDRVPGHLGSVRLQEPGGLNHLVTLFTSEEDLRRWETSEPKRELDAEGDAISTARRQRSDSTDGAWLAVPSANSVPRWKTLVVNWLVVYPLLLVLSTLITSLPVTARLPSPAQLALSSLVLTATLTFVVLPVVSRRLRPWLVRHRPQEASP